MAARRSAPRPGSARAAWPLCPVRPRRTPRLGARTRPRSEAGYGTSVVRDELLAAIESGDHQAVHKRGWGEIWESLATNNAPRQGCTLTELRPYAKLLAEHDAGDILEALEACAGEFRPVPGQLKGYLNGKRGESTSVDVARGRDLATTEKALRAVAGALRAGEQPCSCDRHWPQWGHDEHHVLRCLECGGIEPGQVHSVEDARLIQEAA